MKLIVLATSLARMASASPGFWKWTMYISSPKRWRRMAMGSAGGLAMKGVLRPITPATRSGWRSGICQTTMPPQSWPQKTAFSIPSASSTPTRSPVRCAMS